MKTIALIISMMTLITFNSLGQNADIGKMMQNTKTRNEVYNTIMNSHEMMTEFMKAADSNDHARMMMMQNYRMMNQNGNMMNENGNMNDGQHMMNHGQMMDRNENMGMGNQHQVMGMMMDDPSMMPGVMNRMMNYGEKDSTIYNQMTRVMARHPQMMKAAAMHMNRNGMNNYDRHAQMMNSVNKK